MKKILSLFASLLILTIGYAQDNYHQELLTQLEAEYGLSNPTFPIHDQEQSIINDIYVYGSSTSVVSPISGFSFENKLTVKSNAAGNNQWDSGMGFRNTVSINKDDVCLMVFWGRKVSSTTDVAIFIEDANTYEKEVYSNLSFQPDWTQYFVAFKSSKSFSANNLSFGLHLASQEQEFELAGITVLNFGKQYPLEDVPSIFSPGNYEGNEDDASWRAEAATRIEELRKANLNINVVDLNGNPIEGASVSVEMQKHDFGFGAAFVTCRFPGNNCYDATYVEKAYDLDGKGHGFNVGVTENGLKWDAWEEGWLGTPTDAIRALRHLTDNGVKMRGHTLVWPGWDKMPDDMYNNRNDLNYLTNRLNERMSLMLTNSDLDEMIDEWDVINEFTVNRDLENAYKGAPGYPTGREVYLDIFNKTTELAPEKKNYINDYVTLSNGGFGNGTINRYKSFIQEVIDGGAKVDGIGFQGHIGSSPTSILKVKNTLDDFYNDFGLVMKITEYDIDDNVDEATQAKYLGDFLTMIFSHPHVEAFIMWGFWDGNHWKGNAPMFDINWNLKPSGERFNELVFGDWWTEESGRSNADGKFSVNAFKGEHLITVFKEGTPAQTVTTYLTDEEEITVMLDVVSSTKNVEESTYLISPNPTTGQITINLPELEKEASLQVYNSLGQLVLQQTGIFNGYSTFLDQPTGTYLISIETPKGIISQKLIITD